MRRESDRQRQEFLALYDAPAFVRRAQQVEAAHDQLLGRCARQRAEWLTFPRICVGVLHARARGWEALGPLLADDQQVQVLRDLHRDSHHVYAQRFLQSAGLGPWRAC